MIKDIRKELLRMCRKDQKKRESLFKWMKGEKTNFSKCQPMDMSKAKKIHDLDRQNTARLKEIINEHGWPSKSQVGEDGARAAWLIVQHADHDISFQKKCLRLIRKATEIGEANKEYIAFLTDRVLVNQNKKQKYGTQFIVEGGKLTLHSIKDKDTVDKRRLEFGLSPLSEYVGRWCK